MGRPFLRWRWVLLALLTAAPSAHAIPALARRYQTSCATCHAGAFPALNAFGRAVLENGLQYPAGAEPAGDAATRPFEPGGPGERLAVLREVPLSVRAQGSAMVPVDPRGSGRPALGLSPLEGLQLLVGTPVYRDVSLFAAVELTPTPQLHHGAVGVHNLFSSLLGEGKLHLRAGKLLVLDFVRPAHRELSGLGNPGGSVRLGLNPVAFDDSQLGAQLYGRLFQRSLFWSVAALQGATRPGSMVDADDFKDLFGQLQFVGERLTLGGVGYLGRAQMVDLARATAVRFSDRFWMAGADAELAVGPVSLFAWTLFGRHDNPTGWEVAQTFRSFRGELDAYLDRSWTALVRYDSVFSPGNAELTHDSVAMALLWLPLTNLKLSAEYVAMTSDLRQSALTFRLDVSL